MICAACKGFRVLARRATGAVVECPHCDGSGSADLSDLAGAGIAEGGHPSTLPAAIAARRLDPAEAWRP